MRLFSWDQSERIESVAALPDVAFADINPSSKYEFGLLDVALRCQIPSARTQILSDPSFVELAAGHQVAESRRSELFGHFDGHVADTHINALPEWQTSATALESYAKCPYSYFLAHELNVDERIDPEESLTLSPLDEGILVHAILERFLQKHGVDRSAAGLEALRDVANQEFDRFQNEEFIGYNAIFDLEKVQILRKLETWHRTHLVILAGYDGELLNEESFGYDDSGLGQLNLEDGFGIQFRGKIDLIAISPERDSALVFDFKTGNSNYYSEVEKDLTDSGTKLQLPIYSIVASELLGNTADVETAFWFVYRSGDTRLRPKSKALLMDAVEQFRPKLNTIVNGIRSGTFPARPGDRATYGDGPGWKNCKYCAYSDVCPSDRLIAWNRKKSDPALEDYVALAEPSAE